MKRQIITTEDGSTTIHMPEWDEQYHSKHGAIQEAYHVFIEMGFFFYLKINQSSPIKILEIGFGTGLNTFITLLESEKFEVEESIWRLPPNGSVAMPESETGSEGPVPEYGSALFT